jgi:hypothetical protein
MEKKKIVALNKGVLLNTLSHLHGISTYLFQSYRNLTVYFSMYVGNAVAHAHAFDCIGL